MSPFDRAGSAPRALLYLASFNRAERAIIAASPELRQAIRESQPSDWAAILARHQAARRSAVCASVAAPPAYSTGPEHERQLRYAQTVLSRELRTLAAMRPGSGRNDTAFRIVCRIGRWVHHGVLAKQQVVGEVLYACERNGLVAEDGRKSVLDTIASGLARSAADALPELGARHG